MVATDNQTHFAISGHGGWLMELWQCQSLDVRREW